MAKQKDHKDHLRCIIKARLGNLSECFKIKSKYKRSEGIQFMALCFLAYLRPWAPFPVPLKLRKDFKIYVLRMLVTQW